MSHEKKMDGSARAGITRRELFQNLNAGLVSLGVAGMSARVEAAAASTQAPAIQSGPRKVREIENVWIEMSDGKRLAARIWLPEDAQHAPVPALLEYIPYRKRDVTRIWDELQHSYYASHGYACVRVDIRGSGDSDGAVGDEYIKQEQDDGVEIIDWLSRQRWCTGKVGMFGLSWGGFSSLQVAARRPPALKAIIVHCASDDRFGDDMHYSGGCINEGMFVWSSVHTTNGLLPPDPEISGPQWREKWRQRLESLDFFVGDWLSHHHRDEFWKHGSISEDYGQIECAVYAVGGWTDPYHSAVPRLLANLGSPRKGLMGPWNHNFPHEAWPGPKIDWLSEALRWWDHWLKGTDTGIMREPMYRAWMPSEVTVHNTTTVPGRWVAEESWPSARIKSVGYFLNEEGLGTAATRRTALKLQPIQTVGITAPYWFAKLPADLPTDQRIDDARSLVFDSSPLDQNIEMLGAAVAHLDVAVDKPVAYVIARLCELTAEGVSQRVTYGVLNLCHINGDDVPTTLEPGKRYSARVQLGDMAHTFKAGSRIRVAISTTCWPLIWPSPEPVTLTVFAGSSRFELPRRAPRSEDKELTSFGEAFSPRTSGLTTLVAGAPKPTIYEWNAQNNSLRVTIDFPYSRKRLDATGTEMASSWTQIAEIDEQDPASARIEAHRSQWLYRPGWDAQVETVLRFSTVKGAFLLECEVSCLEGSRPFFSRKWRRSIPRRWI